MFDLTQSSCSLLFLATIVKWAALSCGFLPVIAQEKNWDVPDLHSENVCEKSGSSVATIFLICLTMYVSGCLMLKYHKYLLIEWASAQVPPTPLYLGGTVGRERGREGEGEGEGEMDAWMDGWMDG